MTDQQCKRRRLNPFIDVDAVGEADGHEEETQPSEELSEGASLIFDFLAPTHLTFMPDESQEGEDDRQDADDIDVHSFSLRNTIENAPHGEEWNSFIARSSSRGKCHDHSLGRDERLPRGEDHLWEIGCVVSGSFEVNNAGVDPLHR